MLAFFRPDNPTAHYSLNLSRQLDRVIAARLLVSSIQEGYWSSQSILANFRNVTVGGEVQHGQEGLSLWIPNVCVASDAHRAHSTSSAYIVHAMFADMMPLCCLSSCSQS